MNTLIEQIKRLREESKAGVMECRAALEEANGSYPIALALLREKAAEAAAKRANRDANQGLLEVYCHAQGRIAVMVEINTETDFAGRSPLVRAFAHEVALQVAAAAPIYLRDEDIPNEVLAQEARKAAALAEAEPAPEPAAAGVIAGRLEKFKTETVLLRQPSIRDEKITVSQMLSQVAASTGENVLIRRFVRWELGDSNFYINA